MILSEFAGAAQSLNGSLIINPWDKFATADAIHEALTMPIETRTANFEKLRRYVNKHTSAWWGVSFVNEYVAFESIESAEFLTISLFRAVLAAFKSA